MFASKVLSTTQRATIHPRQKRTLTVQPPQNSHDGMTWALALAVAHCMQMPSQGVGAAMLPPSEKIPPLEKVKPLSSSPFWQAFISKIQQDGCQASE
jgi:hypothetical protein